MENEKGLFAWLADVYRAGYKTLVEFWCSVYCAQPQDNDVDLARHDSWAARETAVEKAP